MYDQVLSTLSDRDRRLCSLVNQTQRDPSLQKCPRVSGSLETAFICGGDRRTDFCLTFALFAPRGRPYAERLRAPFWLLGLRGGAHPRPLRGLAGPQRPRGSRQTAEAQAGPLLAVILAGRQRRRTSCRGVLGTTGQSVSDALAGLPLCPQHHRVVLCAES